MAGDRLVILDPSGRSAEELCEAADRAGIVPVVVRDPDDADLSNTGAYLLPVSAAELAHALPSAIPRWLVGDGSASGKLASAAISAAAAGVILMPVLPATLAAVLAGANLHHPEVDLARARSLIAASVLDATGEPTADGLSAIARAFAADDCVFWWREHEGMVPWGTRTIADLDQPVLGAAARVAAATGLTVIGSGGKTPSSVIAAPLAPSPHEVAGLIAVVADRARRFVASEVADLRALASRLPRELTFRAGYRRLMGELERLATTAGQDALTGALSRNAFDQEVAAAISAAGRRSEPTSLAVFDVVGLRRINLEHGHRAGDEVLAAIASRIQSHGRGLDRVGRFGGDEIAVLYPGTSADRAHIAAMKLVTQIAATPIATADGDLEVAVRAAVTGFGTGERSGEAGFARLRQAVRTARPGEVVLAPTELRGDADGTFDDNAGVTTGTTLGGAYRILHELSRGAMGVVYRGEDLGLDRQVAIKVLRSDLASDAQLVAKFRAEAAMLASLHHTNLVQVYSLGQHQGDVYFVMELVEGVSLAELLDSNHAAGNWLPVDAIAQIVLEIGDALDAMHAIGLIHRDVKPANVLLDRERDRAVLVDVGVAKRRGDVVDGAGTPGYAAPESFLEGGSESPETDVYGLAATVYCGLTGRPPFGAGALMQVITRQLHDPLVPPSSLRPGLTDALDEVLAKALQPEASRRFQSASAFAIALARALKRTPRNEDTRPTAPVEPSRPTRVTGAQADSEVVLRQTEHLSGAPRAGGTLAPPPRPGMIRAAHFRIAARVIAHLGGDAVVRAVAADDDALAAALAPGASPLGWLPLALLCELVRRAEPHARRNNTPDASEHLMRAIGRSTVSATLARFLGADPATLGVSAMLGTLPSTWSRYHGWCTARVLPRGREAADVIITGAAPSPLALHLVESQLAKACELAGGLDVTVDVTASSPEYRFALAWAAPAALSTG
ncbi:MAG TPA: protein kinase [Kofleriaceae bacterium]|nr:protein kinase [Kofleriaceae bacterium]